MEDRCTVANLRDVNGLHVREMKTEYLGRHESHHKPLREENNVILWRVSGRLLELTDRLFLLVDGERGGFDAQHIITTVAQHILERQGQTIS